MTVNPYITGGPPRYRHQKVGLRRMIATRGVTALLFDPGMGKTATVIDYAGLLALKHPSGEARVLVISPLAAVDTWVLQMQQNASPQVQWWAEAIGGTIKQRAEALAARGGRPFTHHLGTRKAIRIPRGQSPRAFGWKHARAWAASDPEMSARQGPEAVGTPRLVLCVLNLDTFSSRTAVGSRTMADVLLEAVKRYQPDLVVVDESHKIKSASGNASRLLGRIGAIVPRRVILTGTVMPHAVTLDTPILTPTGWKPMGEIQVGDRAIGANGKPTEVVGVWPQGEKAIYTITFSDGSTVDCTEDHLWTVTSRGRRSKGLPPLTLSTGDLVKGRSRSRATAQEVGLLDKGGSARWAIPTVEPVDFPSQPVPLDPYLVGLLLGDGHLGHPVDFTTADEEIVKYAEAALPPGLQLTVTPGQNGSRASRYRITSGRKGGSLPGAVRGPAPNPVAVALDDLGLRNLRGPEKFIPEPYLWNTVEVRLEVLRGLMDADGTASVGSTSKFVTSSPRLAEGVKHLVRSLGGYVTERIEQKPPTVMPQGHTSQARPQHVLLFGMPFNPFRVTRKAEHWRPRTEQKLRTIVSIEPKGQAPAQCITVAAKDGLFVTQDFVVTHNSPLDVYGQWRFLAPEAFSRRVGEAATYGEFKNRYAVLGGWMGKEVTGFQNLDEMQDIMARNAVVARKEQALDLPPTTDVTVPVTLSPREKAAYTQMKDGLAAQLSAGTLTTAGNRLTQMLRLRQITSGLLQADDGTLHVIGSSKVDTIRSLVHDTLTSEKRVVIFVYFVAEARALAQSLAQSDTEVLLVTGDTASEDRALIRKRFGSDDPARLVLIAQIKTMSLAVNELVTASHAIFASLSQQRDDYIQARDRLSRIGQTRPVTFWHVNAPGTVDDVILRSHQDRSSLEDAMLHHIRGEGGEA